MPLWSSAVPSNRSNDILGLSNTLNSLLSFLLSYNLSLWCCSQNHTEFSELKRRDKIQSQRLICHHYLQKTTGNDELDLSNTLNSLVLSILPYNPSLQNCSQNRTQFSGFRIPRWKKFSTLICSHYSQPGSADSVLDLSHAPNLLVSSILRSGHCWMCYRNKHHQFSEFRILKWHNSTHWYAPTTLGQSRWCCTWPVRCAESHGAIHFVIWPPVVALQAKTWPIFGIENPEINEFPTLIYSHYCQPGTKDCVVDLLDAPIITVPSVLPYNPWVWPGNRKCPQFSHFQKPTALLSLPRWHVSLPEPPLDIAS